jgi:hypothetical protein
VKSKKELQFRAEDGTVSYYEDPANAKTLLQFPQNRAGFYRMLRELIKHQKIL